MADKKKKVGGVEGEDTTVDETVAAEYPKAALKNYTKPIQRKIKAMLDEGIALTGEESEGEIETRYADFEQNDVEEATEQEEITGVPNKLPVKTEPMKIQGKDIAFPIHHVAAVKGGFALYNERGQRISGVCVEKEQVQYINKAAARNNALRRASRLPEEMVNG
jgi:hypothetical protein